MSTTTNNAGPRTVTDIFGFGAIARALALPILLGVIGYLNGCP